MKVLFVEDEAVLAQSIRSFFRRQSNWDIDIARDGNEALAMFERDAYAAVIIDWNLPPPGPNGLEVCRLIRLSSPSSVLLFATARNATADLLDAFAAGADEYVTKPFDPRELAARVSALIRRASVAPHVAAAAPNATSGDTDPAKDASNAGQSSVRMRAVAHSPADGALGVPVRSAAGVTLKLTSHQAQVLECMVSGLANKEIAKVLRCSVKNAEYHVGQILRKAQCSSRAELIALMWQGRMDKHLAG